jgi:energy-coupling factor transport system ATP-binding protein
VSALTPTGVTYAGVTYAYPEGPVALRDVHLEVDGGEVLGVVGGSGSGKSTLLRAATGIVPHTTGGRFGGEVVVCGRSTRVHPPRELAGVVGFVHQDPEAQFVVDEVERDVAFVLENLGYDPAAMRRRVEEALDALGIAHLRHRNPRTLSGGERQRAAIAGALAAAPQVLVLDEPTSQLDPQGADDTFAALRRLNDDLGTTVLIAEHRLERLGPMADRLVVTEDGRIAAGPASAAEVLASYPGAPAVTRLGVLLGWDPPPLTVREARARLAAGPAPDLPERLPAPPLTATPGEPLCAASGLELRHGDRMVLRDVTLELCRGEVVALLGRNGAGKTTLLRALAGLHRPHRGSVRGAPVAYVPQDPGTLLFAPSVAAELAETLRLLGGAAPAPATAEVERWLARLHLEPLAGRHPRSLSSGQRQRVAIAAVAVGGAPVLALDEPTRGMDAPSATALVDAVADHAAGGGSVVLATHDTELAARVATRVVVLGDGEVVADGPARQVLAGSLFAPQVLRVLPGYLTPDEVAAAGVPT